MARTGSKGIAELGPVVLTSDMATCSRGVPVAKRLELSANHSIHESMMGRGQDPGKLDCRILRGNRLYLFFWSCFLVDRLSDP